MEYSQTVPPGMDDGHAGARPVTKSPNTKCSMASAINPTAKKLRPMRVRSSDISTSRRRSTRHVRVPVGEEPRGILTPDPDVSVPNLQLRRRLEPLSHGDGRSEVSGHAENGTTYLTPLSR